MKILAHKVEPYSPVSVRVTASIENNGIVAHHQVVYSNSIPVDAMLENSLRGCCEFVITQELRRYLQKS